MKKFLHVLIIAVIVIIVGLGIRWMYFTVIKKATSDQLKAASFRQKSVSGIFPHLALFNENHADEKPGETGIGAVVPWGDKLYAVTYSAHRPMGSSDKLYVIDKKLNSKEHPLSIGGTPANRMIHKESKQLIIGPYFIKESGAVRVVPIEDMPGRLTGTARHLTDPANKVYFYTMEEGLYEVDVYTLEVTELYKDGNMMDPRDVAGPLLPGYHGKGAYTAQDRLIVANNGEYDWQSTPESGSLSEWDGEHWKVIERKQFTEVTGPGGLYGNGSTKDPVWSTGWDEKSLILKLRDQGDWHTYRLPKASFTYDGRHGWHTEWPRIRDIGQEKWLMTMHGMFWAFPPGFSASNTSGIRPLSSYLKIIPDFTSWQGYVLMACDDVSAFDNAIVGQPQSNFWFVEKEKLTSFGPRNASGGLWRSEPVAAFENSDPFLVGGFDQLMLVLDAAGQTDFVLSIEQLKTGSNNWEVLERIPIFDAQVLTKVITIAGDQEWLRFSTDQHMESLTLHLHLTQAAHNEADPSVFESLSRIGESELKTGWLRPDGESGDLLIFGSKQEYYYTLNEKLQFDYVNHSENSLEIRENLIPKRGQIRNDSASVIYIDPDGGRWRLPWGTGGYEAWFARFQHRKIREVATERSLLNAGGIFYELPREISGGISRVKPIATHNCMILDFCAWRGLMVMSGTRPSAQPSEHYYFDKRIGAGLWLGTIDDLWNLDPPTGMGGPWNNDHIRAGEYSDPYLMYGFKNKSLFLNHNHDGPVSFEIEADFFGDGDFKTIQVVTVGVGESETIEFEEGFVAHWVRVKGDVGCFATAWLIYQ